MAEGWKNIGPARWELTEGELHLCVFGDFENSGWKVRCPTIGWTEGLTLKAKDPEAARVEGLAEVTSRLTLLAMQVLELNGKLETSASKVSIRSKPGGPVSHGTAHAFASIAAAGALELERQKYRDLVSAAEGAANDLTQGSTSRNRIETALAELRS